MSLERIVALVSASDNRLSIVRQCELVGVSRSAYYYRPSGESELNLELMRVIDKQFLATPWYGSRQMARHLRRAGYTVGRARIRRLVRKMGLQAIYQKPRTSAPHPTHRIYPYLLGHLSVERPNQVWCADITYIPMQHGFLYLVAVMDWHTRAVLSWRVSNTMDSGFCVEALRVWWAGIQQQVNVNRPIQYFIFLHSIVLDGWRDFNGYREYHMNYGWANGYNAWYTIDNLHQIDTGNINHEQMLVGIVPNVAVGSMTSGVIPRNPAFPYRYVEIDYWGNAVTFQAGQLIQFLPGVIMGCASDYVRIEGTPENYSRLYTPDISRGIVIQDGALVIYPGGEIKFWLNRQKVMQGI